MKTKAGNQNRFLRMITVPFRAARDFYVRSMIGYATKVGTGSNYMGTTSANYSMDLPRSFSANASVRDNDDLRDLIRAASARSIADRIDVNNLMLQEQIMMAQRQHPGAKLGEAGTKVMPPRSQSVGMARIDEEKTYAAGTKVMPPRSQSVGMARIDEEKTYAAGTNVMPPRSQSVGMSRIDEEKPYAAGEITPGKSSKKSRTSRGLFFRSKSHGLNKKSLVL